MKSLKSQARVTGLLYLLLVPTGVFSLVYVPSALYVTGDAVATAQNIAASELLYRGAVFVGLLMNVLFVLVVLALYRLLKEFGARLAMLMVVFVAISVAVSFANTFNLLAVLIVLERPDFLSVFSEAQLQGLAYLFARLHSHANQIIQVFWGLWLVPLGMLVYRSGIIPRIFGVGAWLAASGYLISVVVYLLFPEYKATLFPVVTALEMFELPLILWLVTVGVRSPPG